MNWGWGIVLGAFEQHRFNYEAIKDAVERMKPELKTASEAAHKMKDGDNDNDDDEAFDRTVELGFLVESIAGICGPHLCLLCEIANALHNIEEGTDIAHHGEQARVQ